MNDSRPTGRVVLNVPYVEKDEAKQLGAKWDPRLKRWFVPSGIDANPFRRWFTVDHASPTNGSSRAAG